MQAVQKTGSEASMPFSMAMGGGLPWVALPIMAVGQITAPRSSGLVNTNWQLEQKSINSVY
jgi:hypothetical protein